MRIWVTRAAPEAESTAARLRALGHAPLVASVLEVRPLHGPPPDLAGVGAIAFTSRKGVFAFAEVSAERRLPAFAVGEATARAARDAGFADVESADGDVDALAAAIAAHRQAFAGAVLHAGPKEPAGDLPGALRAHGIEARLHAVYETGPAAHPLAAVAALSAEPMELDAVMVHSPKAAEALSGVPELSRHGSELDLYGISEAAVRPLRTLNFRRVATAPFPNEPSLLNLLAR